MPKTDFLALRSIYYVTVNSINFAIILFLPILLKDILGRLKIYDFGLIYLHQ